MEALAKSNSPTCLIVDDEEGIRALLRDILEDLDFNVVEAENGSKALELIEKQKIDYLISDVRMPELDGSELLSRIPRAIREKLKIVMMSAYNDRSESFFKSLGATELIPKPFRYQELVRVLQNLNV